MRNSIDQSSVTRLLDALQAVIASLDVSVALVAIIDAHAILQEKTHVNKLNNRVPRSPLGLGSVEMRLDEVRSVLCHCSDCKQSLG